MKFENIELLREPKVYTNSGLEILENTDTYCVFGNRYIFSKQLETIDSPPEIYITRDNLLVSGKAPLTNSINILDKISENDKKNPLKQNSIKYGTILQPYLQGLNINILGFAECGSTTMGTSDEYSDADFIFMTDSMISEMNFRFPLQIFDKERGLMVDCMLTGVSADVVKTRIDLNPGYDYVYLCDCRYHGPIKTDNSGVIIDDKLNKILALMYEFQNVFIARMIREYQPLTVALIKNIAWIQSSKLHKSKGYSHIPAVRQIFDGLPLDAELINELKRKPYTEGSQETRKKAIECAKSLYDRTSDSLAQRLIIEDEFFSKLEQICKQM